MIEQLLKHEVPPVQLQLMFTLQVEKEKVDFSFSPPGNPFYLTSDPLQHSGFQQRGCLKVSALIFISTTLLPAPTI